ERAGHGARGARRRPGRPSPPNWTLPPAPPPLCGGRPPWSATPTATRKPCCDRPAEQPAVSYRRVGDFVHLTMPLTDDDVVKLKAGDRVRLFGGLLTGRDAGHQRLIEALDAGRPLSVDVRDHILYCD